MEINRKTLGLVIVFSVLSVYLMLYTSIYSKRKQYSESRTSKDDGCFIVAADLEFKGRIVKINRTRDAGRDDTLHILCSFIHLPDIVDSTIYRCSRIDVDLSEKTLKFCVSTTLVEGITVDGRRHQSKINDFIIKDKQSPYRIYSSDSIYRVSYKGGMQVIFYEDSLSHLPAQAHL